MTIFINPQTGEYPLFPHDIKQKHPNVSFPKLLTEETVAEFGYRLVEPTTRPIGDVVEEGSPVNQDGVWKQVWTTRQYNQQELNDIANRQREQTLMAGINYTFPGGVVDCVKVTDRDMSVLTNIRLTAQKQLDNPEFRQLFRSKNNHNYSLTASEALAMAEFVIKAVEDIYIQSWDIKDAG